ncbi:unnamed protein product [Phytomonas sp. EM1]|nr:unnamed protein product [Phytomonas sp. EM1]|eukprot:CCW62354.1 unnamed protein product [Phytomonas sp. isolate EM1]
MSNAALMQQPNLPLLNSSRTELPSGMLVNENTSPCAEGIDPCKPSTPSQLWMDDAKRLASAGRASLVLINPSTWRKRKLEVAFPSGGSYGEVGGNNPARDSLRSDEAHSRHSFEIDPISHPFSSFTQNPKKCEVGASSTSRKGSDKEPRCPIDRDDGHPFSDNEPKRIERRPRQTRFHSNPRISATLHSLTPLSMPSCGEEVISPNPTPAFQTDRLADAYHPPSVIEDPNAMIVRRLFAKISTEGKSWRALQEINASLNAANRITADGDSAQMHPPPASFSSSEGNETHAETSLTLPPIAAKVNKLQVLFHGADERLNSKVEFAMDKHKTIRFPNRDNRSLPFLRHCNYDSKSSLGSSQLSRFNLPTPTFPLVIPPRPSPLTVSRRLAALEETSTQQATREKERIFAKSCEMLHLLKLLDALLQEERNQRIELLGNFISCRHPLPCACTTGWLSAFAPSSVASDTVEIPSLCFFVATVLEEHVLLQELLLEKRQSELVRLQKVFEMGFFAYSIYQETRDNERWCWEHLMAFHHFCMRVASLQANTSEESGNSITANARTADNGYDASSPFPVHRRDSPFCSYLQFIECTIFFGGMERHEENARREIESEEAQMAIQLLEGISLGLRKAMVEDVSNTAFALLLEEEASAFSCFLENALEERGQIEAEVRARRDKEAVLEHITEELKRLPGVAEAEKVAFVVCYEKELRAIHVEEVRERHELELCEHRRLSIRESIALANQWLMEGIIAEQENSEEYQRNLLITAELRQRNVIVAMKDEMCRLAQIRNMYLRQEEVEMSILILLAREYVERQQIIQKFWSEYQTLFVERFVPVCAPQFATTKMDDAVKASNSPHKCGDVMKPENPTCDDEEEAGAEPASSANIAPTNIFDTAASMDLRRIIVSDLYEYLGTHQIYQIFST